MGTVFNLTFWAWSKTKASSKTYVIRTVIISDPCPDPAATYFCRSNSGELFCSPLACDVARKLMPSIPKLQPPSIRFLPSTSDTIYVQYGSAPPVSLTPCTDLANSKGCGAVAWGNNPDTNVAEDLTSAITVEPASYCTSADVTSCSYCTAAQASMAGTCPPGVYTFRSVEQKASTYCIQQIRGNALARAWGLSS